MGSRLPSLCEDSLVAAAKGYRLQICKEYLRTMAWDL
jgi:hypothetical protein